MSLFALADLHLSLADNKPMDIFGNRWKGYVEKIETNWNRTVTENDTVVVPGDISWSISLEGARDDLMFLDSLNGKKIIMRGNHDYWWSSLAKIRELFDSCGINSVSMLQNNAFLCEGVAICGSRGWYSDPKNAPRDAEYKKIVAREVLRLRMSLEDSKKSDFSERTVFTHFPPVFGSYVCREIVDLLHEYDIKRCFFGHIHTNYEIMPEEEYEGIVFTIVSSDYLNFTPLLISGQA